jgi:sugar-specific transcriptional regulator TrmB
MIPEPSRLLGEIGISENEEQVYRALLGHRMATVADISRIVALAPRKTQQLLDAIEAKGLVTRSPERPRRYIPISPDIAVEALVRQRQDALDRTRASIQILAEQAASAKGADEREQIVELLTSNDAARQAYEHLQRTSQREAISLQRPPIVFNERARYVRRGDGRCRSNRRAR